MGHSKRVRGLFVIKFIRWGVCFGNVAKGKGLIAKGLKRGGVLLLVKGKGRGLWAKTPFLPPPRVQNRGGGWGAPAAADSAALDLDGGPG